MRLEVYVIDAFVGAGLLGNPAGVCPASDRLSTRAMQAIAAFNDLPETAFLDDKGGPIGIRWFTPTVEVPLCGHATLASAHVLLEELKRPRRRLAFRTSAGLDLAVEPKDGGLLELDFPAKTVAAKPIPGLAEALGRPPRETFLGEAVLAVFDAAGDIRGLAPDFARVAALGHFGVIATAPGDDCDIVSRFFAPNAGIDEDPATGFAHTILTPFWSKRLGKVKLHARQVSTRGGELFCEQRGDRVGIAGRAHRSDAGILEVSGDGQSVRRAA